MAQAAQAAPAASVAVPADVAALLSSVSLSQYGGVLCDHHGVTSVSDLRLFDEAHLERALPALKMAERLRLLAALEPNAAALAAAGAPRSAATVPDDVAALLSGVSLSQYGTALCDVLGVASMADLQRLSEAHLKAELPGMRVAERMRLLAALQPAAPARALAAAAPALDSGGGGNSSEYDFFLSHYQLNGAAQMGQLAAELKLMGKRAWYDKNEVPNEENMMRGVAQSAVLLLFLTRDVFTRYYCRLEIREALRLSKPIVLLRETNQSLIYYAENGIIKPTKASIIEHKNAGTTQGLASLFEVCVVVRHRQDQYERKAMIKRICNPDIAKVVTGVDVECIPMRNTAAITTAPLTAAHVANTSSSAAPAKYDFFLCHYQLNGGVQMGQLAAELQIAGKRVWYDRNETPNEGNMLRGIAQSAVLLLFLTRDVFTRYCCRLEIREALRLGKPFILLRETNRLLTYVAENGITMPAEASIQEHMEAGAAQGMARLFDECVIREHRQDGYERTAMVEMLCDPAIAKVITGVDLERIPMRSVVAGPAALHVAPASTPDAVAPAAEFGAEYDVFIGYRVQETGSGGDGSAFALRDALQARGFSVFLGEAHNEDSLPVVIQKGVESCKAFVALCSPTYGDTNSSKWTYRELVLAANLEKLLIPVWHSGPYPPRSVEIFLSGMARIPGGQVDGYVAAGISHEQVAGELAGVLVRAGVMPQTDMGRKRRLKA